MTRTERPYDELCVPTRGFLAYAVHTIFSNSPFFEQRCAHYPVKCPAVGVMSDSLTSLPRLIRALARYAFSSVVYILGPPLWSSGQSFWLQIQRSRVRSPALPDFLSSSGSGTGSTQHRELREVNWGATWIKKSSGCRSRKQRLTAVGTRCADHVTPLYPQKLALTSPTGVGRSIGIVRVRTKATEFSF